MICEIELRCLQYEHECNQKMHFIYKKQAGAELWQAQVQLGLPAEAASKYT